IMTLDPFADLARYKQYIRNQARLQQITTDWYQNTAMHTLFPELAERDRLAAVQQDCRDLELSEKDLATDEKAAARIQVTDRYAALGWLYTVEGSNIGAAILLKHAKKHLGLSEEFGARHLAGHG